MSLLTPQDISEPRVKCAICGFELTYTEFLYLKDCCVFHAESLKPIKRLSIWVFLWHALNELRVTRGKVAMKERGLTHIDYMATVCEAGEELHKIDSAGLKKLVGYMKYHTGHYEQNPV